MKYTNVAIRDYSYYLSDEIVTSEDIETRLMDVYTRLKLPHGRLELMTGIKERRMWAPKTLPSDLSTKAALNLFEKQNVNKNEIDLLIHASVCRDFLEPSTASIVHGNLGLKEDCMIYDLSNACLGVISAWAMAANMIELGQIKNALIVSGENGGPLIEETIRFLNTNPDINRKNIKKYIANLTIGSGAVAFVLSSKDLAKEAPCIVGGAVMTDSTANKLCQGDGDPGSLMMETDSEELLQHGIVLASKTWNKTKEVLNWTNDDVNWVIGHQVGTAHEKLVLEALGLSSHPTHITYDSLGNTGSAALPITLIKLIEENKVKKGDKVALVGIGSGLTSLMFGVQW